MSTVVIHTSYYSNTYITKNCIISCIVHWIIADIVISRLGTLHVSHLSIYQFN